MHPCVLHNFDAPRGILIFGMDEEEDQWACHM